jgi:hypothetical protein
MRIRVLCIQPTTWGFAYAVLEGESRLIGWGTFKVKDERAFAARLDLLRRRFEPQLVVVEDVRGSQRGLSARQRIQQAIAQAGAWGISSATVARDRVKALFPETRGTKYEIACELATLFPPLRRRLPNKRKPWLPEDKRMGVFDAVSFALTVLKGLTAK